MKNKKELPDIVIQNTYSDFELPDKTTNELSRTISSLFHDAHQKFVSCLICGKKMSSPCKSHSLPKFVLKEIADDGKINTGNYYMTYKDKTKGVGNTFVFGNICNDCDSKFFQDYENPSIINNPLSTTAINEIETKNLLRSIYKRTQERSLYQKKKKKNPDNYICEHRIMLANLDLESSFKQLTKLIKHKNEKYFYVIDELVLPYKTQLAFQGFVALTNGFDGLINDIYNFDPQYRIEELGICVYPYKDKTKILLYCRDGDTRLRLFYKKYRKLSLDEKLYVINYIILLYTEEWVTSASFDKKALNKATLLLINQNDNVLINEKSVGATDERINQAIKEQINRVYSLKTSGDIYNFLAKHE